MAKFVTVRKRRRRRRRRRFVAPRPYAYEKKATLRKSERSGSGTCLEIPLPNSVTALPQLKQGKKRKCEKEIKNVWKIQEQQIKINRVFHWMTSEKRLKRKMGNDIAILINGRQECKIMILHKTSAKKYILFTVDSPKCIVLLVSLLSG